MSAGGYRRSVPRSRRMFGGAVLPDVQEIGREVGAKLAGELVCGECSKRQPCSAAAASGYLAKGWPVCCGYTMELRPGGER